jgi:hypothetical protein
MGCMMAFFATVVRITILEAVAHRYQYVVYCYRPIKGGGITV